MKRCPACNRVESDDTLAFCRADGTPLVTDSLAGTNDARHSSEIETSLLPHRTDAGGLSNSTDATTAFAGHPALAPTRKLGRNKSLSAIMLTVAGLIVVALVVFLYLSRTHGNNTTIDSIAVLPFVNTSYDPNTDFLSDGITESIISSLSQLSQLKVMARSTVFQYKGKEVDPRKGGHDLGVRAVLMGRLIKQRSGTQLGRKSLIFSSETGR